MGTRLIIHTDSRKQSDVNTFKSAALTLKKGYQAKYPTSKDVIKLVFVKTGKDISRAINSIGKGNLISLDIISHGNQGGIHISRDLVTPVKAGFIEKNAHEIIRRNSDRPQTETDAEFKEESMHGLYSDSSSKVGVSYYYNQVVTDSTDIAILSDIKFEVFTDNAVVEFHGCRTAEVIPVLNTYLKDNFAKNFSDNLNKKAVVIGHVTNSAPDKNPNGNHSDYRYGRVRVYKGGVLVRDKVDRSKLNLETLTTP